MIPSVIFHAVLLSTAALAAPFTIGRRQAACPPSHIIAARGSLEPQGPGSLLSLAEKVMTANPGTTMESIDYPATIDNYDVSSTMGTSAVEQQLTAFVQKCPSSKVAMLGFSQGAHIVGDAMGGGGIQGVSRFTPPLDRAVTNSVTAVVMYGDPRHVVKAPFNVGTATTDGIFPRSNTQSLDSFADKTRAFCNTNDPFCAQGDDLSVHLAYPQQFDTQAAEFVTAKFQGLPVELPAPQPQLSNSTAAIIARQLANATAELVARQLSNSTTISVGVRASNATSAIEERQLSNSTIAIGVRASNSTIAVGVRASNSTTATPAARVKQVYSPWSYAVARFTPSRLLSRGSSASHVRSSTMKPRSPWANAKLKNEKESKNTSVERRQSSNGTALI